MGRYVPNGKGCGWRRRRLTDEETEWLKSNFADTRNAELAEHLGVSTRSLNRYAKELGLEKSAEFMRMTQRGASEQGKRRLRLLKENRPEEYRIWLEKAKANFEKCTRYRFGPGGWKCTPEQKAERNKKRAESWKRALERDRKRVSIGLKPLTKLRLGIPSKEREQRYKVKYNLHKNWGYITDKGLRVYYTEGMRRSPMEHLYTERYGLKFEPLGTVTIRDVKLPPDWKDGSGGTNAGYFGF